MMFGYSDSWWTVFMLPVMLWLPLGPVVMLALGITTARRPGWRARLASVLVPLLPVVAMGVMVSFPLERWDRSEHDDDFYGGYLRVYVGLLTLLPWLLGYLVTRAVRAVKGRRGAPVAAEAAGGAGQEDISPPR
ncbi:hypothetical protein ACIRBX_01550 [Kitasatospora sp. NPDC096147]|uniref:hypothetical protein n=1 Tax=Kitasatospora sp. NPDC096147 TaxID=3364093 RepID=UPI00380E5D8A